MSMHWGVPLIGDRVAPRCTRADGFLLARVSHGRVISHARVEQPVRSAVELLDAVIEHDVEKLVCGGVSREVREALAEQGVAIVENVACSAAEVLAALDAGSLCAGYGLGRPSTGEAAAESFGVAQAGSRTGTLDCLACEERVCLMGQRCEGAPLREASDAPEELGGLLEAATDIAREEERTLCRVAELVYFCLEMHFRRVGLAFCKDLLEPSRILADVLRRFFDVVPVWCKVGGIAEDDADAPPCNPLGQAAVLNAARTDVNVVVGLCVGADCLFDRASQAPVTHLFVKDRSLANNPIGALYSDHYLRESADPAGSRRAAGNRGWPARLRARAGGSAQRETRS
jgi:uncharacterized metal-binding protein/predicted Fe-Mo cluster-binding NifX family protein